jgi:hypothetical protein
MAQESEAKSVLAIIATLDVFPDDTIVSLIEQTVPPKTIIIVSGVHFKESIISEMKGVDIRLITDQPNKRLCLGKRVARALNRGLELINLDDYDYILKADMDIIFPLDFIKSNLSANYELMGKGASMLIDVPTFQRLMNGRFFESCADDEYLHRIFVMNNAKVLAWSSICEPHIKREKSKNCWRRFRIGEDKVRCGDPLIWHLVTNLVDILLNRKLIYLFDLMGYLIARKRNLPPYPYSREWACFLIRKWKNRRITKIFAFLDDLILKRNSNNCNTFRPNHVLVN